MNWRFLFAVWIGGCISTFPGAFQRAELIGKQELGETTIWGSINSMIVAVMASAAWPLSVLLDLLSSLSTGKPSNPNA